MMIGLSLFANAYLVALPSAAPPSGPPTAVSLDNVVVLPSSPPGRAPAGFTCTGLSLIGAGPLAGHWLVADDGRLVEGDGSTYVPQVHILTPDFSAIFRSLPVGPNTHSAQGVAFDSLRGGFWVALSVSGWVRYFSLEGVEDPALSFKLNAISGLTSWSPNALAYAPSLDQLICAASTGKSVRRFYCDPANVPSGGNRHVAGQSFNLSVAGTTTDSSPDHFCIGSDGALYFTLGANGSNGTVRRVANPLAGTAAEATDLLVWTLPGADAIEGLHYDAATHRLHVTNDRGFHATGATNPQNTIRRYLVPPVA